MTLLHIGKITEQLAHTDVLRLFGGLGVKSLGLELHDLRFLTNGVERQIARQPSRAPTQESFDVLPPNRRQIEPESLLV
jgi:hypothetical protein